MNTPEPSKHSPSDGRPVRLPLFPLSTVLTPGARLPLRVFEPRYVRLLQVVSDPQSETREFGVIGIRLGREVGTGAATALFKVGCTAQIDHLATEDDGHLALLITGRRRFELVELDETAGTPYLTGMVRFLDEPVGDPERASDKLYRLREELKRYLPVLGAQDVELPDDPVTASHRIAELARLTLPDRGDLLAAPTAEHRLALAVRIVRREWTLLTQLRAVPWPGPSA